MKRVPHPRTANDVVDSSKPSVRVTQAPRLITPHATYRFVRRPNRIRRRAGPRRAGEVDTACRPSRHARAGLVKRGVVRTLVETVMTLERIQAIPGRWKNVC